MQATVRVRTAAYLPEDVHAQWKATGVPLATVVQEWLAATGTSQGRLRGGVAVSEIIRQYLAARAAIGESGFPADERVDVAKVIQELLGGGWPA